MWSYVDPHLKSAGGLKMASLRIQKLIRDKQGIIASGSASIVDTVYDPSVKGHARHKTRVSLGKVIYLSDDRKNGIFLSPEHGLVSYDVDNDKLTFASPDDPRIPNRLKMPRPQIHTNYGDVLLFVHYLKNHGWLSLLRSIFPENEQYERTLAHLVYGFLSDGSNIRCETFIEQSAICHVLVDMNLGSLQRDTAYFDFMGEDAIKRAYFLAYASKMRKSTPKFGKACYVDSSEIPNDEKDNPYNALRCERGKGCMIEFRLGLVLDMITDMPVWFQCYPGNIPDCVKFFDTIEDVHASLGIDVISAVVDAGYVNKDLITKFASDASHRIIARMPHRPGYPWATLYSYFKSHFFELKYDFMRNGRSYFGGCRKTKLFDTDIFAYVYVDKRKALRMSDEDRAKNPDDYAQLTSEEKEWHMVKFGYFVLISNHEDSPLTILTSYLERVMVEMLFRTGKEFERLLPLSKWSFERVRGKLLEDIILTTIRSEMYKELPKTELSLMDMFHNAASVGCVRDDDKLIVETPSRKARDAFTYFQLPLQPIVDLRNWKDEILNPNADHLE